MENNPKVISSVAVRLPSCRVYDPIATRLSLNLQAAKAKTPCDKIVIAGRLKNYFRLFKLINVYLITKQTITENPLF